MLLKLWDNKFLNYYFKDLNIIQMERMLFEDHLNPQQKLG